MSLCAKQLIPELSEGNLEFLMFLADAHVTETFL
jgi:hypothetical protein